MELKTKPEFKKLMRALSKVELDNLEESLLAEGCREPLITWNGFIIDGHNRYELCKRHNIDFRVIEKEFESDNDTILWIITNQLGRRNLMHDLEIVKLVLMKKEILLKLGLKKMSEGGKKHGKEYKKEGPSKFDGPSLPQEFQTVRAPDTQKQLAIEAGVSVGKFNQAQRILKEAPQDMIDEAIANKEKINKTFNKMKLIKGGGDKKKNGSRGKKSKKGGGGKTSIQRGKVSDSFRQAWGKLRDEIIRELRNGWKDTDKKEAQRLCRVLWGMTEIGDRPEDDIIEMLDRVKQGRN